MLLFPQYFRDNKINNKYQITKTVYKELSVYLKKSRKFSLPTLTYIQKIK
jgi:hypothetical protein